MEISQVKSSILNFIKEQKELPSLDIIKDGEPLIEGGGGILDSFDVIQMVTFLEEEYSITFVDDDITEEKMNTIESISSLILLKLSEQ